MSDDLAKAIADDQFNRWMAQVDAHMGAIAGITHECIADWGWRDAFQDQRDPKECAEEALIDDGFPAELLEN